MIRRLVEANYETFYQEPNPQRIRFWLDELRTPDLLLEAVIRFPQQARDAAEQRPAVAHALAGDAGAVQNAMDEEMEREKEADRAYWAPLRKELERLRMERGRRD